MMSNLVGRRTSNLLGTENSFLLTVLPLLIIDISGFVLKIMKMNNEQKVFLKMVKDLSFVKLCLEMRNIILMDHSPVPMDHHSMMAPLLLMASIVLVPNS